MSKKPEGGTRSDAATTDPSKYRQVEQVDEDLFAPLECFVKALPHPKRYLRRLLLSDIVEKCSYDGVIYVSRTDAFAALNKEEQERPFSATMPDYAVALDTLETIQPGLRNRIKKDPSIVIHMYRLPGSKEDIKTVAAVSKAELLEFCARKQSTLSDGVLKRLKDLC